LTGGVTELWEKGGAARTCLETTGGKERERRSSPRTIKINNFFTPEIIRHGHKEKLENYRTVKVLGRAVKGEAITGREDNGSGERAKSQNKKAGSVQRGNVVQADEARESAGSGTCGNINWMRRLKKNGVGFRSS